MSSSGIVNLIRLHFRGRSVGQGSAAPQHSMPQQPEANLLADGGGWPGCELSSMRALCAVPVPLQDVKHQQQVSSCRQGLGAALPTLLPIHHVMH